MKTIIKNILVYQLVFLWILFEELIYKLFVLPFVNFINNNIDALELKDRFSKYTPYQLVIMFSSFFILSEILGFVSIGILVSGYVFIFALLYTFKTLLAILAFFILKNNVDKLNTIAWFYHSYKSVTVFIEFIRETEPYKIIVLFKDELKDKLSLMKNDNSFFTYLKRLKYKISKRITK